MPLQNRVTPEGDIIATPERGLFMGNRGGQMHDGNRRLTGRRFVSRAWITCLLEYKGWHEEIMRPGRYTQLFFMDEATALSAGHRPCALCRRQDFNRFMGLLARALRQEVPLRVGPADRALHGERLTDRLEKRTFRQVCRELPGGTMVRDRNVAMLVHRGRLHPWTPGGYGPPAAFPDGPVDVLTPPSIVSVLKAGYEPLIHPSAHAGG